MSIETIDPDEPEARDHEKDYKKIRRGEGATRLAKVAAVLGAAALLFGTYYNTFLTKSQVSLIRSQQVTNTSTNHNTVVTIHQVKRLLATFEDCISPDGKCSRQGAARTKAALTMLERTSLAQIACGWLPGLPPDAHSRQHAIAVCVSALLNEKDAHD